MDSHSRPPSLAWLQVLRFVAALAVFLHHGADQLRAMGGPEPLARAFHFGFAGADVFFVLSGVIMWHSAVGRQGTSGVPQFVARRVTRIYSGYWPALALCLVLQSAARAAPGWDRLGSVLLLNPHHWQNFIPQAWSLAFELYFYGLCALLLLVPAQWRAAGAAGFLTVLVAANARSWPVPAPFPVDAIVSEFVLGMLLCHAVERVRDRRLLAAAFLAGGLSLATLAARGGYDTGAIRSVVFGGTALCTVGGVLLWDLHRSRTSPAPGWLVQLGDSSFALYLLHGLGIHYLYETGARDLFTAWGIPVLGLATWVALTVALAHAWYLWVERPALAAARRLTDAVLARQAPPASA